MGTTVTGRRGLRDRDRLHLTVRQLVEAGLLDEPVELPRYLKSPPQPGVGSGWVWKPAGQKQWQMLGANAYLAHARLLQLSNADADVA